MSKNSKKNFIKFFKKSTKKCKDEWLKIHRQNKQKIEKMHFCTAYIKIGNPKENTMCEYSSKIKK